MMNLQKLRICNILAFLLIVSSTISAQQEEILSIRSSENSYFIDGKRLTQVNFYLKNISAFDCWLWFSDENIEGKTGKKCIQDHFFFKQNGISFYTYAFETEAILIPDLFHTFTKKIKSGQEFVVSILVRNRKNAVFKEQYPISYVNEYKKFLTHHMCYYSDGEINKYVKNANSFVNFIYYPADYLTLTDKCIKRFMNK